MVIEVIACDNKLFETTNDIEIFKEGAISGCYYNKKGIMSRLKSHKENNWSFASGHNFVTIIFTISKFKIPRILNK